MISELLSRFGLAKSKIADDVTGDDADRSCAFAWFFGLLA